MIIVNPCKAARNATEKVKIVKQLAQRKIPLEQMFVGSEELTYYQDIANRIADDYSSNMYYKLISTWMKCFCGQIKLQMCKKKP